MEEKVFSDTKNLLADNSYAECWLKYAVERDYKELLTQCLKFENNEVLIQLISNWKKYMLYVYKLDNNVWRWGEERCFCDSIQWSEEGIQKSYKRVEQIPRGEVWLPFSKRYVTVEETFNATLKWSTILNIENKEKCEKKDCLFYVDKKTGVNGNEYWYKRVVYNKDTPYELEIEEYNVTQEVERIHSEYVREKGIIDSFSLDEFWGLYEEVCLQKKEYRIKNGNTKKYEKGKGNSRTWEWKCSEESQIKAVKNTISLIK